MIKHLTKACRSRGIKVAAPPLDLLCDRPITYPGDSKILEKSSKGRSGPFLIILIIIIINFPVNVSFPLFPEICQEPDNIY
jgi:hypothetical protein